MIVGLVACECIIYDAHSLKDKTGCFAADYDTIKTKISIFPLQK